MTEALTVNGVSLASLAYMLGDISGINTSAPRRGENILVPGRNGALLVPRKKYDTAEIVLPLFIAGCLPDGSVPAGSSALKEFFARRDELLRLFAADTVQLDYTSDGIMFRRAVCEVVDVLDFTRRGAQPEAQVSVALRILDAFWSDVADVAQTFTGTTGLSGSLTAFESATAPMDALKVTFGPGSNPRVTQGAVWLQYSGVIGAGQTVVIDSGTYLVTGTGGITASRTNVTHSGEQRLFVLVPGNPPQVVFTHTGGGSASVTFTGRRKYLVP